MRDLVQERFAAEDRRRVLDRAPGPDGNGTGHLGTVHAEIRDLVGVVVRTPGALVAFEAVWRKGIDRCRPDVPARVDRLDRQLRAGRPMNKRNKGPRMVESSRKLLSRRRLKVTVAHVVLPSPEDLDRLANGLRQISGLGDVVRVEAATKPTAHELAVHGDR